MATGALLELWHELSEKKTEGSGVQANGDDEAELLDMRG